MPRGKEQVGSLTYTVILEDPEVNNSYIRFYYNRNRLKDIQDVCKIAVQVLKQSGLTLGQIERETGIDRANLSNYMSGRLNFSRPLANKILSIFNGTT